MVIMVSCSKEPPAAGTASLTIVNTVVGSRPLSVNFNDTGPLGYYKNFNPINNYSTWNRMSEQFTAYSGKQPLALYQYPDTLPGSQPLFNLVLDLPIGSIHSLFLTGTVSAPDTIFTTDLLPYYPATDSSMGIRFVNLSPGSAPITVNLQGQANGSEAGSLPFKGISGFKNYKVDNGLFDGYVFEFRDAASGTLIATLAPKDFLIGTSTTALQYWLYRSFTLAMVGLPGATGTDAQQVVFISHSE